MVATAPDIYKKYVTFNRKGDLVPYVEALNALYGIIKVALLFYIKFFTNLKSVGFQLNPYVETWLVGHAMCNDCRN